MLCLILTSCSGQDINITLKIHNKSGKVLDSVKVTDVFRNKNMYYNIKKDSIITYISSGPKSSLPRGEATVFYLTAFENVDYYVATNGFIGFPTAYLKDEYEFYIYDTYIAIEEGYVTPDKHPDQRKSLEEYRKQFN